MIRIRPLVGLVGSRVTDVATLGRKIRLTSFVARDVSHSCRQGEYIALIGEVIKVVFKPPLCERHITQRDNRAIIMVCIYRPRGR